MLPRSILQCVNCQKDHRPQHKRACKKRAAESRDELLFKQPESSHLGDCPICCLPLPLDREKSIIVTCCSKFICNGCFYTNQMREIDQKLSTKCPFCRETLPGETDDEECDKRRMKRVEMNDPAAMADQGAEEYDKGDYDSAFQYWAKSAKLGDIEAHYRLAGLYIFGKGVRRMKGR